MASSRRKSVGAGRSSKRAEEEGIRDFVEHLLDFTVRIIRLDNKGQFVAHRSGFLYQPDWTNCPFVLTAGHNCSRDSLFIEGKSAPGARSLCYSAGVFEVHDIEGVMDIAYSHLPIDGLGHEQTPSGVRIPYVAYRGPFIQPTKREVYGFAVWNNYELVQQLSGLTLPEYSCNEWGMKYSHSDAWQHFFKVSRDFQPDEFYEGASGSPICDPEGVVCSMLLGRTQGKTPLLRGLRMNEIDKELKAFIGIGVK
jgi:hypothetical protein